MYKLEKIAIDEGKESSVRVGMSAESHSFLYVTKECIQKNIEFSNIELRSCLCVYGLFSYVKTSAITKIISVEDDSVVFKTTSSTYKLSYEEIQDD